MNSKQEKATDVQFQASKEGMIDERVVSHKLAPEGSFSYLENMTADTIGILTSRKPYVVTDHVPSANINAGCIFLSSGGGQNIVYQEGTSVKYVDLSSAIQGGATHTPITGFSFGSYVTQNSTNFESIQGYLLVANPNGSVRYTDVSGAASTAISFGFPTTPGSAPNLISAGFDGRVWGANNLDQQCRVYYSNEIPAAGIISTTGTGDYLRVNATNNDRISGFYKTQEALFVFTQNNIFRIFNTYSIDNSPIANVGAVNQSSIVPAKDGVYFFHSSGVYRMSGSAPVEISSSIRPIIERISSQNFSKVVGWSDNDHVYFSVGPNVTGLTPYTDASQNRTQNVEKSFILRYCISTKTWSIDTIYNNVITSAMYGYFGSYTGPQVEDVFPTTFLSYTDLASNNPKLGFNMTNYLIEDKKVGGDMGTSSNTNINSAVLPSPIFIDIISPWRDFGAEIKDKDISGIAIPSSNAAGLKLFYQTESMSRNQWKEVGALKSSYITMFRNVKVDAFKKIKFRVAGDSLGSSIEIGQPVILAITDKGYGGAS